jgi:anti-sigma B factor antagonist
MEADMPPFQIEAISAGDCAVLRVAGEIDVYSAPELREQIIKLIESGARYVVADLRGVDFLDSSGLGVLVGGLKRLRLLEGSLTIVTAGGAVPQLFELTGLSRAFTMHTSVLAAITADQHWDVALAAMGDSAQTWCRDHALRE